MADDTSKRQSGRDAGARVEGASSRSGESTKEGRSWARERSGDVREVSREKAREFRMRAEDQTDRWTSSLGEEVTSIAHAFRDAGETLEEEGKPRIADWTRAGADGVDRLAGYLRDEDPREMIDDLTSFARSNPALFAGTTFVGGLLLGRFLRSSRPEDGSRRTATGSREAPEPRRRKEKEEGDR